MHMQLYLLVGRASDTLLLERAAITMQRANAEAETLIMLFAAVQISAQAVIQHCQLVCRLEPVFSVSWLRASTAAVAFSNRSK